MATMLRTVVFWPKAALEMARYPCLMRHPEGWLWLTKRPCPPARARHGTGEANLSFILPIQAGVVAMYIVLFGLVNGFAW